MHWDEKETDWLQMFLNLLHLRDMLELVPLTAIINHSQYI